MTKVGYRRVNGACRKTALICLMLVGSAIGFSCDVYGEEEQLCEYESRASAAFSEMQQLPVIPVGSSASEVAVFGRIGANEVESVLREWDGLNPPERAEVWHTSMQEWLSTTYGAFTLLGESDGLSQPEVDSSMESWVSLRAGLTIELDQLNRQYAELFLDCP